jgi:dipeptidyl aminopeptidase/acylaminoacyl peptidase
MHKLIGFFKFGLAIFALTAILGCGIKGNKVYKGDKVVNMETVVKQNLIPRDILFGNPDKFAVNISYDGKYITYIAPLNGVLNIYLADIKDVARAKPITNDTERGIRNYFWSYNGENVIYLQDNEGDENFSLYSLNIKNNKVIRLTPKGSRAYFTKDSRHFPDEILVGINDRNPEYHDLYKINVRTGDKKLIFKNDLYLGFIADDKLNIRMAQRMMLDGGMEISKIVGDKALPFDLIGYEDVNNTYVIGFDKSGDNFYMLDSRGRNTSALTIVDQSGNNRVIGENEKADISDVWIHPVKRVIQAYSYEYDKEYRVVLEDSIKDDITYLETLSYGKFEVIGSTLDDNLWIVAYYKDNAPVSYYKYDRKARNAEFLFYHRKELAEINLSRMHPVIIKSRDNLDLISYLTLPRESTESEDSIVPLVPVPLVLYVHGGPIARDSWGYNPVHQWLANRGYAVLSVNYRGSTGFGKKFIGISDGQWGGTMHDDLIDAVEWAIDEGITTRDRIAVMGGSYGGYAALVGLTFTPDVFACGIDLVGPSNLTTLINSVPPYWKPLLNSLIKNIGGDPATKEGREFLDSRSPITYFDKINKPLLIAHGANDPRVKQAESDQIVNKMEEKGVPVTYLLYPDEGHGFVRPENRMSYYAVTEQFLHSCLNGKFEPIGSSFKGSSVQIVQGKELIDFPG